MDIRTIDEKIEQAGDTDEGNAWRMVKLGAGQVIYVDSERKYYSYEDGIFKRDGMAVDELYRGMVQELDNPGWQKLSRSTGAMKSAKAQAQNMPGMWVEELEADTTKVALQNGVLDLETGGILEHSPSYMLSRKMNVAYDIDADCPQWIKYLETTLVDPEVIASVRRYMYYTLFGNGSEAALFILLGEGGTGKSVFISVLTEMFGEYFTQASNSFLSMRDSNKAFGLHAHKESRLVVVSETAADDKFDAVLVKQLTSTDSVTSEAKFGMPVTWTPKFAIWMNTNFMPVVKGDDGAVWDRLRIIKFDRKFRGTDEQDTALPSKLKAELSGILNWVLAAADDYKLHGLQQPESVIEETKLMQMESDSVAVFMEYAIGNKRIIKDAECSISSSQLFTQHKIFCKESGYAELSQKTFTARMQKLGYERIRTNVTKWAGLRFANRTEAGEGEW